MNNTLKKLICLLAIAMLPLAAYSATETITITANTQTNNVVLTEAPVVVSEITIANTTGGAGTFKFFDAPDTNAVWTNSAFTAVTSYTTNISEVFTNFSGRVVTNSYDAIYTYETTIAANTNLSRKVLIELEVPANTTLTYTPSALFATRLGILVTNDPLASGSVTITYAN